MQSLLTVAGYGALATIAMNVGGAVAMYRPPGAKARSYLQHVAAGFVFAAATVEVLPDVMRRDQPVAAGLGFAAGIALTLAIRLVSERLGESGSKISFVGVLVVDLLIDGLLIGVAANAGGGQTGLLVAMAVSVELLALGLSMAATLGEASRVRVIGMIGGVSFGPLLGAIGGYFLGNVLGPGTLEATLAFAVAVFLFMAAEELLKEAHETKETALGTSLFFVAFLCLLLLDMAGRGRS
jgi:ZIP family zinc transporter